MRVFEQHIQFQMHDTWNSAFPGMYKDTISEAGKSETMIRVLETRMIRGSHDDLTFFQISGNKEGSAPNCSLRHHEIMPDSLYQPCWDRLDHCKAYCGAGR